MISKQKFRWKTRLQSSDAARRILLLPVVPDGDFRLLCRFMLLFAVLSFKGCASLPTDYPKQPSTAFDQPQITTMGRFFGKAAAAHPGESGFAIIRHGRQAFTARIMLADLAEKSLDVQYYIWEGDATGRILVDQLVRAADRGVHVRILVDDNNLIGKDAFVAALNAHPGIEVRIFNPFAHRKSHLLDFITDIGRVNHRMHNKVMVMDNAMAIIGGRNIADHYFGVHEEDNFRDLDIAAVGPIVPDISETFDSFWNGDWAYPMGALVNEQATEADMRAMVATMREHIRNEPYPYPLNADVETLSLELTEIRDQMVWAPGKVIWEDPSVLQDKDLSVMEEYFYRKIDGLNSELLIESAYFVPRKRGVEGLNTAHDRGVRIRILTNSLASNDVVAAHAGYAKCRKALIENGVEIHELRPDARLGKKKWSKVAGDSQAALHTKAMVFDRETVFVGSFNIDPRSAHINTEVGLFVESPEIARQVADYMDIGALPENSYRVLLDDRGNLVWVSEKGGREVRYNKEPETSFGRRFSSSLIKLLPIQSQL
jgi:putative cardiolipin synthase